jgi:hypothetical protein
VSDESQDAYFAPLSSTGIGSWSYYSYPVSSGNGGIDGVSCPIYAGYIYCVGGDTAGSGSHSLNATYYAPISSSGIGTWTKTTSFPLAIDNAQCVTSAGYIYCLYGDLAYFAPVSSSGIGAWTAANPASTGAQSCVAALGYVYCIGGGSDTVQYAQLDPQGIGNWHVGATYTISESRFLSCAASAADYIYCVGGVTSSNAGTDAVYYAPISTSGIGPWTAGTNYPGSTFDQGCVISASYIYCVSNAEEGAVDADSAYAQISSASTTSSVSVHSENTDGAMITGFRTVLYSSSDTILQEGFTPNTFTVTVGQTYGIRAESYGSCTFTKWSDGVTSDPRTYMATSSAMTFTAIYNCGTTSSASVDSVNQDGSTITGYRTVLYNSAASMVAEGFTPNTFTTTIGQTYSVRAESYGSCTFSHWSDGVTNDPRTFTATSSAVAYTAVYDCSTS